MNLRDSNNANDALLLLQLEQGNSAAFDALYEKYWHEAYNHAYRRLKDEDQAKDIVQDIFINIWLKKETHIENFPAYLSIAVRNRVFKLVEKEKKQSPFFDVLQNIAPSHVYADSDIRLKEFYRSYETLLNSLPPKRQEIFRLRYQEDLTTKAIADQLELTRKTVQNQLGKAVQQLRISILHLFSLLITLFIL
jgi:RNA polymerase sigma-70 factor (family 1)